MNLASRLQSRNRGVTSPKQGITLPNLGITLPTRGITYPILVVRSPAPWRWPPAVTAARRGRQPVELPQRLRSA